MGWHLGNDDDNEEIGSTSEVLVKVVIETEILIFEVDFMKFVKFYLRLDKKNWYFLRIRGNFNVPQEGCQMPR